MSNNHTESTNPRADAPTLGTKRARISGVLVTYEPNLEKLRNNLSAVRKQVDRLFVVDNASSNRTEIAKITAADACLVRLEDNLGVACAQNRGIELSLQQGYDFILLLDQDSLVPENLVEVLSSLAKSNPDCAAIGPVVLDSRAKSKGENIRQYYDPASTLVYSFTKYGPKHRSIPRTEATVEVPFILASGCLLTRLGIETVGLMDEFLFIDHVDLAWGLRAKRAKMQVLVTPQVVMHHELGDEVVELSQVISGHYPRIFGLIPKLVKNKLLGQYVHQHPPLRNYYLVRNTIFLLKSSLLTKDWKIGYLVYLAKYITYYYWLVSDAKSRRKYLRRALADGIRNHSGKYNDRRCR